MLNEDYAYFEERIDELKQEILDLESENTEQFNRLNEQGNIILEQIQQLSKIKEILNDRTLPYCNRVEIVLELLDKIEESE